MKFDHYFAIYETAPDKDGNKKYFEYNILEKRLLEIEEFTYIAYRESGCWSNIVLDENCLRKMLEKDMNNTISIEIKEIKNA